MFYLILAIISSSLVTLVMRASEKYSKNNLSMLAANYLTCGALGAFYTGSASLFPAEPGLGQTLLLGAIGGVLFLGSFLLLQWNIRKNGVVLPTTFMKLGVIIPTLLSIAVFGEKPRIVQILGILLAIFAIVLMQGKGSEGAKSTVSLLLLLLVTGFSNAMSKIFAQVGAEAFSNHFLFYIFAMAFVLCVTLCIVKKQRITLPDFLCGMAIGIPNYFSTRFMLQALTKVPAVVAYPSYSVSSIVLVTLVGVIVFQEKLSKRKLIALGIILAALVLLNL